MDEHQVRAMEMEAGDRDTCELDISQDCHPLQSTSATQGSPRESSQGASCGDTHAKAQTLGRNPDSHVLLQMLTQQQQKEVALLCHPARLHTRELTGVHGI